jgi:phosphatidylserine decarboxylase
MRFAPGAFKFAALPLLGVVPAFFISPGVGFLLLAVGVAILAFFRDPDRTPPPSGVVSPADGKVSVLRVEGDRVRVGVFMNVHNVHVNRAPVGGEIEAVEHEAGGHYPAFSKDSERNERVRVRFSDHDVTLIAGAFARRITPYVTDGETVERGERIGHIAFGSRADVLLPPRFGRENVTVDIGDRVRAGETVIAEAD